MIRWTTTPRSEMHRRSDPIPPVAFGNSHDIGLGNPRQNHPGRSIEEFVSNGQRHSGVDWIRMDVRILILWTEHCSPTGRD